MNSQAMRTERDSMGEVAIPAEALYGPQTERARQNFTIGPAPLPWEFISAIIHIKKAAAQTNAELGLLPDALAREIAGACEQLLTGAFTSQFPLSMYQTGSATSTNMNVNEVIVGLVRRAGSDLSANDHVNLGQSSNDVIPSALHIATFLQIEQHLLPALDELIVTIRKRAAENHHVLKTGRTHLMDALPIRLSSEMEAWAAQLVECQERFAGLRPRLGRLALGGTAVGSGLNCHPRFARLCIARLSEATGGQFTPALSTYKALSSLDTALEISGHLKTLAVVLSKIANDLRWMNSGPLSGLGEISLPALQPGSSIMPAKVNPVIPEAVCMAAAQVIGLDTAVTIAAQSGNFQLNTMLPLAAGNLLQMITLLGQSAQSLAVNAIAGMRINKEVCTAALEKNPILVTALNPEIGYLKAAELAHIATREQRSILDVAAEHTGISREKLSALLDPARMAGDDHQHSSA